MHDQHHADSLIDLNRAGVPLIEIVTEPDMRSSEEAGQFLTEVRKLVRYLDICDGNIFRRSVRKPHQYGTIQTNRVVILSYLITFG